MSTDDEPQLCGAIGEPEWNLWFECALLPGHAGDHEATYTWTNELHGPARPPKPATPHMQWLQTVYDKMMAHQLELALAGSPFVDGDRVMQVVNRDREMMRP